MKQRVLEKKLVIKKELIAALDSAEMSSILAGNKTDIGQTCLTDNLCCPNGTVAHD